MADTVRSSINFEKYAINCWKMLNTENVSIIYYVYYRHCQQLSSLCLQLHCLLTAVNETDVIIHANEYIFLNSL